MRLKNLFIKIKEKIANAGRYVKNAFRFQKGNVWDQVLRLGVIFISVVILVALVGGNISLFKSQKTKSPDKQLTATENLSELVRQELDRLLANEYYWVVERSTAAAVSESEKSKVNSPVYPDEVDIPEPEEARPKEEPAQEVLAISFDRILWPVKGEVGTEFGWYRHPTYLDWRFNGGVNLASNSGENVRAVLGGRVETVKPNGNGFDVVIQHGSGWQSVYRDIHLVNVNSGESVKENQVIATSGTTGQIFFGLLYEGEPVDPMQYMSLY